MFLEYSIGFERSENTGIFPVFTVCTLYLSVAMNRTRSSAKTEAMFIDYYYTYFSVFKYNIVHTTSFSKEL